MDMKWDEEVFQTPLHSTPAPSPESPPSASMMYVGLSPF